MRRGWQSLFDTSADGRYDAGMTRTHKPRLTTGRYAAASANPDHARRRQQPALSDSDIEQRLEELVKPAVFAELDYYHQLGLRNRLLNLPVMVSIVLAMIWRQVPGVNELQRLLAHERILWTQPTKVSQPALSQRFLSFPAELFERVLSAVLARLPARRAARSRPVPVLLQRISTRFAACYALDGTTLEALFRKLQALQEVPEAPLAGHLAAVVDLVTHLPAKIWYTEDPAVNDKAFVPSVLAWLPADSLLVFDLGYFAFTFFDALTKAGSWFVSRLREKTTYTVQHVLLDRPQARDRLVRLGKLYGDKQEILAGLQPGDKVIAGGVDRAVDGGLLQGDQGQ